MSKVPATFLDVRAEFLRRGVTFTAIAKELETCSQYVGAVVRTYWQRPKGPPRSELAKKILARVEAHFLSTNGTGSDTIPQVRENPDTGNAHESRT